MGTVFRGVRSEYKIGLKVNGKEMLEQRKKMRTEEKRGLN